MKQQLFHIVILIFSFLGSASCQNSELTETLIPTQSQVQAQVSVSTYKASAPIVWEGVNDKTISSLEINNPGGHCIKLSNCSNITIRNCKLGPSKGEGVFLSNCTNITVTYCTMDSVESGVVADIGSGIKVTYNNVKNVLGPMPRGQMVQFGNVNGSGNCINYNNGENILGQSHPEDEISLYMCNGTAQDPIQVVGNWIRGG